jgi:excisionase family DNA binding protein
VADSLTEPPTQLPRVLGYRRRDFARAVGVSVPTVERWLRNGVVGHVKLGGTVIIPASEAARLLTINGGASDGAA